MILTNGRKDAEESSCQRVHNLNIVEYHVASVEGDEQLGKEADAPGLHRDLEINRACIEK
jgi:hypothetical protein